MLVGARQSYVAMSTLFLSGQVQVRVNLAIDTCLSARKALAMTKTAQCTNGLQGREKKRADVASWLCRALARIRVPTSMTGTPCSQV